MDHKETVLTTCEEEVVVVTDLHTLNGSAVSLDLIDLSKLRHLINMNGTGLSFLSNTGNKSLLVGSKDDLRQLHASIKPIFVVLAVPYLFVMTHSVHLEWLSGDVDDRCEIDILLVEVLVVKSLRVLLLHNQIVEVYVSVYAARCEAGVVLEPVDASHLVHVALALIVGGAVLGVEVVHPYGVVADGTGEQVTAVGELNFPAGLDLEGARLRRKLLTQHVVDRDFVQQGAYHVETARVEGHRQGLIGKHTRNDLQSAVRIVPDADRLVLAASHH